MDENQPNLTNRVCSAFSKHCSELLKVRRDTYKSSTLARALVRGRCITRAAESQVLLRAQVSHAFLKLVKLSCLFMSKMAVRYQNMSVAVAGVIAVAVLAASTQPLIGAEWPATGDYSFTSWAGPPLNVYFSVPPGSNAKTPILIVIPGKKRNADEYRDDWNSLAGANHFITLVVQATKKHFPTEYQYNLGGVVDAKGNLQPKEQWLFSALDPVFEDFKRQFGSNRETYSLYGHSAGGGFVHLFMLMMPEAKVDSAVAANPAFCTMPNDQVDFPFGLKGIALPDGAVKTWFAKPLTIMLGDHDLNPRTEPLSNGPDARLQGPHCFARGLEFYRQALVMANSSQLPLNWRLEIVPDAAHDDAQMAPSAVKHLSIQ
jgi:poly(3-hydroxybutyrate) depolymerase